METSEEWVLGCSWLPSPVTWGREVSSKHMKKAARPINGRQEELAVLGVYTGQDVTGDPPKEKPVWVNKLKVTRTPSVPNQILKALHEPQKRVGCSFVSAQGFFCFPFS